MKPIPQRNSGGDHTKLLYFNPTAVTNKYVDMMRQREHDVVTTSTRADAFAMMRGHTFDALVLDGAQDTLDILNFTTIAHGLQPSLAVFLADEWGDELASGLEELTHVLTMLEDDEFARLKVESLIADYDDGSTCFRTEGSADQQALFTSADLPLGFRLVNRQHKEDFGERKTKNRVVCDLKHA